MTISVMPLHSRNDIPGVSAAAERYLASISGAMRSELLVNRPVPVPGLGVFFLRYCPAERRSGKGGVEYLPPRYRVVFERRIVSSAIFARMVSSNLSLEKEEMEEIAALFPVFLRDRLQERGEIVFPGFGRIASEHSVLGFSADASLEDFVNREYLNMTAIPLLSKTTRFPMKHQGALFFAGAVAVACLAAVLLFFGGKKEPGGIPSSRQVTELAKAPLRPETASRGPDANSQSRFFSGSGVVLEPGEFTVVLATYRKQQTAEREMKRMSIPGAVLFVWPVTGSGKQYYRLAAGRFSSHVEAEAWVDSSGLGRSTGTVSIQRANRRVVLHGETGL